MSRIRMNPGPRYRHLVRANPEAAVAVTATDAVMESEKQFAAIFDDIKAAVSKRMGFDVQADPGTRRLVDDTIRKLISKGK